MTEGPHLRGRLGGTYYWSGKRKTFQISYQGDRGQEIRESTRTTDEATAARILEARRRAVIKAQELGEVFEAPRIRKQTIAKCLDAWEIQCKLHGRWNDTLVSDKKQLTERFGSLTADNLTKARIQEYQTEQKQGLSEQKSLSRNSKLNRHLQILTHALKLSGITPTYTKDLKSLRLPEPPARQGFFTLEEFRIVHSALPPHIADAILACWLTGWRWSEIAGKMILKKYRAGVLWSELSRDGDLLTLMLPGERNKGRKAKRIPVTGQLATLIEKREKLWVPGCDLIFCRPNGRPLGFIYHQWKKACAVIGRPDALVHDLRRSRARNWVRAGVSEEVAMKLAGWRTREIFSRYNVVSDEDMRQAQIRTEEYLERQTEKQGTLRPISRAIN